jgi:hypothetical protein
MEGTNTMKPHEIPINKPIVSRQEVASSVSTTTPMKSLDVCTNDLVVTFEVIQKGRVMYTGNNKADAISIYNSLP